MTPEFVIGLAKESILAAASIAGPLLLFGMVMGILVSLLQTVTQMQEQTLTFVPKLASAAIGILMMAPYMIQKLVGFLTWMIMGMADLAPH